MFAKTTTSAATIKIVTMCFHMAGTIITQNESKPTILRPALVLAVYGGTAMLRGLDAIGTFRHARSCDDGVSPSLLTPRSASRATREPMHRAPLRVAANLCSSNVRQAHRRTSPAAGQRQ